MRIYGLSEGVVAQLRQFARDRRLSLSAAARQMLTDALANVRPVVPGEKSDFSEFCGVWTKEEGEEFRKAIEDFEEIDPEDWE